MTRNKYPENWKEIARKVKEKNNWKCERCGHKHDPSNGYTLTVHHLDGNPRNCADWNLACLCQKCHLSVQARVRMEQKFWTAILPVSEWFKPHLKGYLKARRKYEKIH